MDIVIGATPYIGMRDKKRKSGQGSVVEARILNVRHPRKPYGLPPTGTSEKRVRRSVPDPASGRVVTLLIPDGYSLPRDAGSGNYKVLIRFLPER